MLNNLLLKGKSLVAKVFARTREKIVAETKSFAVDQAKDLIQEVENVITPVSQSARTVLFTKTTSLAKDSSTTLSKIISEGLKFLGLSNKQISKATNSFSKSIRASFYNIANAFTKVIDLIKTAILALAADLISTLLGGVFNKLSSDQKLSQSTKEAKACIQSATAPASLTRKPSQEVLSGEEKVWENKDIFNATTQEIQSSMRSSMRAGG